MAEKKRYRSWSRMDEVALSELVAHDMPREKIASRLGRSCGAIGARIARLGIAAATRRAFTEAEDAAIRAARAAGATYTAIARRLGRSEGAVKCRARRLGIVAGHRARRADRKPRPRKCLRHGGRFQPEHRLEFVCTACKESEEWQAGSWMG